MYMKNLNLKTYKPFISVNCQDNTPLLKYEITKTIKQKYY